MTKRVAIRRSELRLGDVLHGRGLVRALRLGRNGKDVYARLDGRKTEVKLKARVWIEQRPDDRKRDRRVAERMLPLLRARVLDRVRALRLFKTDVEVKLDRTGLRISIVPECSSEKLRAITDHREVRDLVRRIGRLTKGG